MAEEFHLEDIIEEYSGLPGFLQESKDAEQWLCEVVVRIRQKHCGREEISWLLGLPVSCLSEFLPSSADSSLLGESLLDLPFLPRGAGCIIKDCKSLAHLNGRRCTVCKDLRDGESHALVIVEGGIEEAPSQGPPGQSIQIARKNLEFGLALDGSTADGVDQSAWPPLSLALEMPNEEDAPVQRPASELLGPSWRDDSALPGHLALPGADAWLAAAVGRLVDSKACGCEELRYLLAISHIGGKAVPPSVSHEDVDVLLTELGFVPEGVTCTVEGSNSRADLNGCSCRLLRDCADGLTHAEVDVGSGEELFIHRKNLRLTSHKATPMSHAAPRVPVAAAAVASPVRTPPSVPPLPLAYCVREESGDSFWQQGAGVTQAAPSTDTESGKASDSVTPTPGREAHAVSPEDVATSLEENTKQREVTERDRPPKKGLLRIFGAFSWWRQKPAAGARPGASPAAPVAPPGPTSSSGRSLEQVLGVAKPAPQEGAEGNGPVGSARSEEAGAARSPEGDGRKAPAKQDPSQRVDVPHDIPHDTSSEGEKEADMASYSDEAQSTATPLFTPVKEDRQGPLDWLLCRDGSALWKCGAKLAPGCCNMVQTEAVVGPGAVRYNLMGEDGDPEDALHPSCGPTGAPPPSIVQQLSSLVKLKADGALSEEEFMKAKTRLLST